MSEQSQLDTPAPETMQPLHVLLAQPRGFCAGVVRAVDIVERALARFGPPVYVIHEIVHNARVVNDLRSRGAIFVESVDQVPEGAHAVFSAHGVPRATVKTAGERNLETLDATCPLVTKVHLQAQSYARRGYEVILIGHAGHPEVLGIMGSVEGPIHLVEDVAQAEALVPGTGQGLAYVTQTTLSVDDTRQIIACLKRRFPQLVGPDVKDICYATQNRQNAARALARACQLVLVIGAPNSSNSNRLCEVAAAEGTPARLIQDAGQISPELLEDTLRLGVTAGASAPEVLLQELIARLREFRAVTVETLPGAEESVTFQLPRSLQSGTDP